MKIDTKLLLRYSGGKYYALKQLEKFWKKIDHKTYVEVFFGGGAVFWAKPKVKSNIINDIDEELIFFLKFIKSKNNLLKLIKRLEKEPTPSKERHSLIKVMTTKNSLDKAFKYFYINRTSFSGKMNNPYWGFRPVRSLPIKRWHERLAPCSNKLKDVDIENKNFTKILNKYKNKKNTLIYLDPPYYSPSKKTHYKYFFEKKVHEELNKILVKVKTPFFLSYDDCSEIRELYKKFYIHEIKFYYRVSNSNDEDKKRIKKKELVITNFKI